VTTAPETDNFYAKPAFPDRPDHVGGHFTKAIQRALAWTLPRDPSGAPGVFAG